MGLKAEGVLTCGCCVLSQPRDALRQHGAKGDHWGGTKHLFNLVITWGCVMQGVLAQGGEHLVVGILPGHPYPCVQ